MQLTSDTVFGQALTRSRPGRESGNEKSGLSGLECLVSIWECVYPQLEKDGTRRESGRLDVPCLGKFVRRHCFMSQWCGRMRGCVVRRMRWIFAKYRYRGWALGGTVRSRWIHRWMGGSRRLERDWCTNGCRGDEMGMGVNE